MSYYSHTTLYLLYINLNTIIIREIMSDTYVYRGNVPPFYCSNLCDEKDSSSRYSGGWGFRGSVQSWQFPSPTRRALTLSLTRPAPSVVGKYFWITLTWERITPRLCSSVSVLCLTGLNTPFAMSVRSSVSIAGRAVAGSSRSALLAAMWNTLVRDSRLGDIRDTLHRVPTARYGRGNRIRRRTGPTQRLR